MLVALHLRRGDAAMMRECKECINLEDPDAQARKISPLDLP